MIGKGMLKSNSLLAVLFVCILTSLLSAQIKIHRNITVEDGLVQSTILSFYTDSQGYVWIGTAGGLSRWDGINFKNYSTFNGLTHARVNAISETEDGKIIIGTINGLNILKNGKFYKMDIEDGLLGPDIAALHKAKNGIVYVGTSRGVNVLQNGRLDTLGTRKDILGTAIKSILEAKDGTIYIGTFLKGVYVYKNGEFTNINISNGLINNKVNDILETTDGSMYFATNRGITIYKNGNLTSLNKKSGLPENYISKIVQNREGEICIATFGGGLCIYKDGKFTTISRKNGLINNFVNTLANSREGQVYIGTNGSGVLMYAGGQFETFNESSGLSNNIIMSISEDEYGNIYLGSMNGGLSVIKNGKIKKFNRNNGLLHNNITGVFSSIYGGVYICTRGGVQLYNPRYNSFKTQSWFRRNEISAIYEEPGGPTYFGAARGVYVLENGKVKWDLGENSNLYSSITKIIKGSDNNYYFATSTNGLIVKDKNEYKTLKEEDGLSNNIMDVIETRDSTIICATSQGLFTIMGDKIDTLTNADGLSDNFIYSLLEGNNNEIYLTTNRGLNIIDFSKSPVSVRVLTHADGLASDECNQTALYKDSEGKIWIGTVRGVTCYDPSKDLPHSITPDVHFTRVRLFEDDIPLKDFKSDISFRYNENYFKFDFIGIDISSPKSVTYKYRMAGLEEDWYETNQRYVQYTNLNDGDYSFEVMARNEWGYWSEPVVLSFIVMAPFWETWWFVSIAMLLLIGTIAFFVTYRFKQLIAIERLRTKIAADLHDNIGSSLTEISIMGEVLSSRLTDANNEVKNGLNAIAETSRSLVDKMSDIVWLVNPKRDSLYDLILRLKDSYTDLLYHKGISFKSNNLKSLEKISLSMEHRQNLYLIFKEAIHNSLKHSNCSEIVLDASISGKSLNMTLHDNGEGFENNNNIGGNGLTNMIHRAGLIGGELSVDSNIGRGTKIQFHGSIL